MITSPRLGQLDKIPIKFKITKAETLNNSYTVFNFTPILNIILDLLHGCEDRIIDLESAT